MKELKRPERRRPRSEETRSGSKPPRPARPSRARGARSVEAPKKPSIQENARAKWLAHWVENLPSISQKLADDADRHLRSYAEKRPEHAHLLEQQPAAWLEVVGTKLKKLSVAGHIKRVALAYALAIKAADDTSFREAVLGSLSEKRQRLNPRTTPLHLLVESVIEYGGGTPEGRDGARKLYNRDVQAIRHLQSRGIPPQEVEELGAQEGEGLDIWARGGKRPTRKGKQGSDPNPDESQLDEGLMPPRPMLKADEGSMPPRPMRKDASLADKISSSTATHPASDRTDDSVAAPGSGANVIEWRNGSGHVVMRLCLPDSKSTSKLLKEMFGILKKAKVPMDVPWLQPRRPQGRVGEARQH